MQTMIERVRAAKELADDGNLSTLRTQEILDAVLGHLTTSEQRMVDNVLGLLSYSEMAAVRAVMDYLDGESGLVVTSALADQHGSARSTYVSAIRKLESAGVVEAHSLGANGTMVKILAPSLKARLLAG